MCGDVTLGGGGGGEVRFRAPWAMQTLLSLCPPPPFPFPSHSSSMVGDWINDKANGHGRFIEVNGEVYVGEWVEVLSLSLARALVQRCTSVLLQDSTSSE